MHTPKDVKGAVIGLVHSLPAELVSGPNYALLPGPSLVRHGDFLPAGSCVLVSAPSVPTQCVRAAFA